MFRKKSLWVVLCSVTIGGLGAAEHTEVTRVAPLKDIVVPLKDIVDVVNFVSSVKKIGPDRQDFDEILFATTRDTTQDYRRRVLLLHEVSLLLTGLYVGLETRILLDIQKLVSENYVGDAYGSSYEMKLTHVLWMSQTSEYDGTTLKSGYNGSCIESILIILEHQKNGNLIPAANLRKVITDSLSVKSIDIGQFE